MRKKIIFILMILMVAVLAFSVTACSCGPGEPEDKTFVYDNVTLSAGTVGIAYSASVASAVGEDEPAVAYALKSGSMLPKGLTLTGGIVSGMPSAVTDGAYKFTIVASSEGYKNAEAEFSITVGPGSLGYNAAILSSGTVGVTYSDSIAGATGADSISYAVKQGDTLPAGLSLSGGTVSGTPSAATDGAHGFTVVASAENYNDKTAAFGITIAPGTLVYENGSCAGVVGEAFSKSLATAEVAEGELVSEITYALIGNLPEGLIFSKGVISGTPTAKTTVPMIFSITASADGYTSAVADFVFNVVNTGELGYTGYSLTASVGVAYSRSIDGAVAAGNPEIDYNLKSGSTLPEGLLFNNGIISGTPLSVTAGVHSFTVVASATGFDPAEAIFTLTVNPGSLSYNGSALSGGTVNSAYSASVATASAVGTVTPSSITYALKVGSNLPAGLYISGTGAITGTPSASTGGTFRFTVVASAENFADKEAVFSIIIKDVPYAGTGAEYIVPHTDGSRVTYVFEAEKTNLTGKMGTGYSFTAFGTQMIIDGGDAPPDAGYSGAVTYLNRQGVAIDFVIISEEDVEDATLTLRLSAEFMNMTINPDMYSIRVDSVNESDLLASWGDWDGSFSEWYDLSYDVPQENEAVLNFNKTYEGSVISPGYFIKQWDCGDININAWPYTNKDNKMVPCENFVVSTNLKLYRGINCISLITDNNEIPTSEVGAALGAMTAVAPIVDCIGITTAAQIGMYKPMENLDATVPGCWIDYTHKYF